MRTDSRVRRAISSLISAAALSVASAAGATTIVGVSRLDHVMLAADGKLLTGRERVHRKVCKIVRVGGGRAPVFMATDGDIRLWLDDRKLFDLDGTDEPHFAESADFLDQARALGVSLQGRLAAALNEMWSAAPMDYLREFPPDKAETPVVEAMFAQFSASGPQLYTISLFQTVDVTTNIVRVRKRVLQFLPGGFGAGGVAAELDAAVQNDPSINVDDPGQLMALIGLEIKAHGDKVGPPIAILRLDATGALWIRKGACGG